MSTAGYTATPARDVETVFGDRGHDFQLSRYALGKRKRQPRKPPPPPVGHIRVHRAVWDAALRAAGGNPRRIEIVSETEVRITNG